MVAGFVALAIVAACALAEWLHARRIGRLAHLAFGPRARARGWVVVVAPLRVVAAGVIGWGLMTLIQFDEDRWAPTPKELSDGRAVHHLVLALDVSPSMDLADAGPKENASRADRARDVLRSILDRLDLRRTRVSVIAFYSKARPVVVDTFDANVVANILHDLPLEHAFATGKTSIYQAVVTAGEIGKKWPADSATLVLVSDGDTLPAKSPPKLPISYSN
ncbi:MAG: VWA domain-containing protein, partial [Planctomycetes bacterium]|nr:VWA domain-containing protein [Planctomycetota bacterium]